MLVLSETLGNNSLFYYNRTPTANKVDYRHYADNGVNIVFADGHAEPKIKKWKDATYSMKELAGAKSEIAWGSQIRSYVLQPYQMVKDTRTGYETGDTGSVLDGDLDAFVEAYLKWQQ